MSAFDVSWVSRPDPEKHLWEDTDERIKRENLLDRRAAAQTNLELFLINAVPFGTPVKPCPTCALPTWDGVHADGQRDCLSEVPANDEVDR